jgi:hypothetical protein
MEPLLATRALTACLAAFAGSWVGMAMQVGIQTTAQRFLLFWSSPLVFCPNMINLLRASGDWVVAKHFTYRTRRGVAKRTRN